ncbi:GntR family transcriptional regulator [Streptomyces sp. CC77]|uniref:GntR family transcriptional regulator n=1 Tax=Streptomyces sp. CC77 TaxID=1906739 RepID=UPI0008DCFC0F|nr:GntR family transcriptional regulator [Streptomyces sp. CC77]OII67472.1 hypothetical protein BJP39_01065 [Streptomyces sp. CC77]
MTSLFDLVAADLRRRIQSSEYAAGQKLPAETALAGQYRVSLPTVRMALERLQLEGLVEKYQGKGNFVRQPRPRISYGPDSRAVDNIGLRVFVSTRRIEVQETVAGLLRVAPGTSVTEYSHLSFREEHPYCLARVFVPTDLVTAQPSPEPPPSPWGDQVERQLAEAGIAITSSVERLTARLASGDEAQTLRIATRSVVLAIERTATDADGRVVAAAVLVLPGDRADAVFTTYTPVKEAEAAP